MKVTPEQRERYRILLGERRDQIVPALAVALGISREDLLARLGVRSVSDLKIAPPAPPPAPRRRGRPPRVIDPVAVLAALRASNGSIRRAAQQTGIPRATLGRYVATHLDRSAWAFGVGVSPEHGRLLQASGISPEVARARGYRSVGSEDVPTLRRGPQRYTPTRAAAAVPGLLIPVWDIEGVAWSQIRPDTPPRLWSSFRKSKQRYINCSCARPVIDVCPAARDLVLDETRTLYITEGARHADAATSHGLACVAVMGVRMIPHDEGAWRPFKLPGRKVVIVFDADVQSNPEVAAAEEALGRTLVALGALVSVARLPAIAGRKTGLDDYLATGHTEAELLATRKFPFKS